VKLSQITAVQSRASNLLHKQEDAAAAEDDDYDDNDEEDDKTYKNPNECPVSEKYSIIVRLLCFPDKQAARIKKSFLRW